MNNDAVDILEKLLAITGNHIKNIESITRSTETPYVVQSAIDTIITETLIAFRNVIDSYYTEDTIGDLIHSKFVEKLKSMDRYE
jgi:hypothetical protein